MCACVNGTFGLKLCQFKLVWFQRIQLAHFTLKLRDNNNLPLRHDGLCDILNLGQFQCCRMHRDISRTPMRRQPAPHSEVFAWAARAEFCCGTTFRQTLCCCAVVAGEDIPWTWPCSGHLNLHLSCAVLLDLDSIVIILHVLILCRLTMLGPTATADRRPNPPYPPTPSRKTFKRAFSPRPLIRAA